MKNRLRRPLIIVLPSALCNTEIKTRRDETYPSRVSYISAYKTNDIYLSCIYFASHGRLVRKGAEKRFRLFRAKRNDSVKIATVNTLYLLLKLNLLIVTAKIQLFNNCRERLAALQLINSASANERYLLSLF